MDPIGFPWYLPGAISCCALSAFALQMRAHAGMQPTQHWEPNVVPALRGSVFGYFWDKVCVREPGMRAEPY